MPLYEYECETCGRRFEVIRKFSDRPLDVCTQCGSGPVKRLPSSPAIQFKGSGFYITDYPKKGKAGEAGEAGEQADRTSTDQKQDAKSDAATDKATKTEGKTETAAKTDAPAKSDPPAKPSSSSTTTSGGTKD